MSLLTVKDLRIKQVNLHQRFSVINILVSTVCCLCQSRQRLPRCQKGKITWVRGWVIKSKSNLVDKVNSDEYTIKVTFQHQKRVLS